MSDQIRIGYAVVRRDVDLSWRPRRRYRGIDRLPYFPSSIFRTSDGDAVAWHRYLDAWEDGHLSRKLDLATDVAAQLDSLDARLEVVYAEVIFVPTGRSRDEPATVTIQRGRSLASLRSRASGVPPPAPGFASLGLDISFPIPSFHSALYQPGPLRKDARLAGRLNEFGLVPESDQQLAAELMEEANASGYGLSAFAVIRVLADPRGLVRGLSS